MAKTPKKYNPKKLFLLFQKQKKEKLQIFSDKNNKTPINRFFSGFLPSEQNLHMGILYSLIQNDLLKKHVEKKLKKLFTWRIGFGERNILTSDQIQKYFEKRNMNVSQVGKKKFITHRASLKRKKMKANTLLLAFLALQTEENSFCTWENEYKNFLYDSFSSLFENGKITQQEEIVYWSTRQQTILSQDDISFVKKQGKKYSIKYFIETKNDILVACTPHPEFIFGDVALAVHPNDKRYKKFVGKKVLIPIINKPIPVIADESVDTLVDNGIRRINPAHDHYGLQIALKHDLPVNEYVLNEAGNFTEIAVPVAGKPHQEFKGNIVNHLNDILNLAGESDFEYEQAIVSVTGEEVFPILMETFVLNLEEEKRALKELFHDENSDFLKNLDPVLVERLFDEIKVIVNKQLRLGESLPLWKDYNGTSYCIQKKHFEEYYETVKSESIILDWIIFNFIKEGKLPENFGIEECLSLLFKGKKEVLYLIQELVTLQPKIKSLGNKFVLFLNEMTEGDQKDMKKVQLLLSSFENSPLLLASDGKYLFKAGVLLGKDEWFVKLDQVFDSLYVSYFQYAYERKEHSELGALVSCEEKGLKKVLTNMLVEYALFGNTTVEKVIFHPTLLHKEHERLSYHSHAPFNFSELLDTYGIDALRTSLLINQSLDEKDIKEIDAFFKQIWNGVRFFSDQIQAMNLEEVLPQIKREKDGISTFDKWILYEISLLWEAYLLNQEQLDFSGFFETFREFVQKRFLGWYLEISKLEPSPLQYELYYLIALLLIEMFSQYAPVLSHAMYEMVGFSGEIDGEKIVTCFPENKEYRIQLLFDICEKVYSLKQQLDIKKHEPFALYLQADPDFLEFFKKQEKLFSSLFHLSDIQYLKLYEEDKPGYTIDYVLNIKIGVKAGEKVVKADILGDLEKRLKQQVQYLEYLRLTFASLSADPLMTEELRKRKLEEISNLKDEIETIELEIKRKKMKH